jgi:hypothetical protein
MHTSKSSVLFLLLEQLRVSAQLAIIKCTGCRGNFSHVGPKLVPDARDECFLSANFKTWTVRRGAANLEHTVL